MSDALIKIEGLSKFFPVGRSHLLKAVNDISFSIEKGEVLGLVGESGCGKSTVGKTLVRLHEPTAGKVFYQEEDIHSLRGNDSVEYCRKAQMIFQNPYSTLNPRMTVGEIIGEGIKFHLKPSSEELKQRISDLLIMVGLDKNHFSRFPHEFSGGQRQRIGIARALSVNPDFLVCDEPISALDVSIQAQIINLLIDLKEEMDLTYLFISHDLNIIKYISDRIVVMYLGTIMEIDEVKETGENWLHPYSQALISAVPMPDPRTERARKWLPLQGEIPSPIDPPDSCRFYERCPRAMPKCLEEIPKLKEIEKGHFVACRLYD